MHLNISELEGVHEEADRHRLFGVDVTAVTIPDLLAALELSVERGEQLTVFTQNLHGAYLQARSPLMRAAYQAADLAYIDGMPFIWHNRLLGGHFERRHRTTYLDWHHQFYELAEKFGWKVFYLGGTRESFKLSRDILLEDFPDLRFDGHDGYFDVNTLSGDNMEIVDKINRFGPDVLIVGMGMPRQEIWVADNRALLDVPAIVTVGAGNDYIAGLIPTPPRWMGRLGLEWLYRLVTEPHRLWRRYLLEPIYLLPTWAGEVGRRWWPF
ncbi:MAG: WecB/TagA/CpsF family glycosyltransferase [Acidimicrobiales bacterium]